MEIVLTVVSVLVFFGNSYFVGNWFVGDTDDTLQDKVINSSFGVLFCLAVVFAVYFIATGFYAGITSLIN
mgnify:CR=1 FL=1